MPIHANPPRRSKGLSKGVPWTFGESLRGGAVWTFGELFRF